MARKLLLTFECEDFINVRSTNVLRIILQLLQKYELRALFFITGHMAEKLSNSSDILFLLEGHEIGYHSSSHSVRPTIFEYTDVRNYEEAFTASKIRETAYINPLTGEVEERRGGIELLKNLFPDKKIVSFRAPGYCWSPPHLESLVRMGIQFDFSTCISTTPVCYKGVTFYPLPMEIDSPNWRALIRFLHSIARNETTILDLHPDLLVNQNYWSSIYCKGNPEKLYQAKQQSWEYTKSVLQKFIFFIRLLHSAEKQGLLEVTPPLRKARRNLVPTKEIVQKCYERSILWPKTRFNYEPNFLRSHFFDYFEINQQE